MSSFDGVIREFNVAVDYFEFPTFECSYFFLSHCHFDHMKGLFEAGSFFVDHLSRPGVFLYCSEITCRFLSLKFPQYSGLKSKIVPLQLNVPCLVQVRCLEDGDGCQNVAVSAIPAGHCPGSVMFLFEGREKTVLYTGDFRVLKGDIQRFKPLHCGAEVVRAIDTLYLDTTFFNPKYWQFPTREQSVLTTCHVIKDWISNGPKYHACLMLPAWTGTEYLFARVAKCFKTRIHILKQLFLALKFIPEIEDAITEDFRGTQIHAVLKMRSSEVKQCLTGAYIKEIYLSAKSFTNMKADTQVEWCRGADNTRSTSICYSSHCSYSELEDVVRHLKPRKVFPCVKPFDISKQTMKVLIQRLGVPQVDLSVFPYDYTEEQVSNQVETREQKCEVSCRNTIFSEDSLTVNKSGPGQSPVVEKLVDSPPPKRKRLSQLTLS